MLPRHHVRRAVEATAIGCVVGHVAASACGLERLKRVTRPPLMLLLAARCLCRADGRRRDLRPLAAGLILASAGDTVLMSPTRPALLAGIALFAGTHLCYLAGWFGAGATRAMRARPSPTVACLAGYLAATGVCWRRLGRLRWPVTGYGLLLSAMVATATSLDRGLGAGAGLFALSDLTIGARLAGVRFPGQSAVIAASYVTGQAVITGRWSNGIAAAGVDAVARG